MRYNQDFKFFAEDFWNIFNKQKGFCALTGRKLHENNTEVELRNPHLTKEEGRAALENHYIVERSVKHFARYNSEDEIIQIAAEIIKFRGAEYGYRLIQKKEKDHD